MNTSAPAELTLRQVAILVADVVGYSRLMASDGPGTVAALDAARETFRQQVAARRGQVVDMAGDSVLAVFDDAIAAVRAALTVQAQLADMFASVAEAQRMRFRIGLHQGEVLSKSDGTVYGDGVNIAARLEALAEAGGIMVSAAVANAVRDAGEVHFVDQGEQLVKNIPYPVHAFRWVTADRKTPPGVVPHVVAPRRHPSIAVLPFVSLSNDPEQDYFAEGIAEDLITALCRMRWLTVIARNSSFTYRGQALDVREIGAALGARYVLEGSVRGGGKRVRVSCRLVDTSDGKQLWAERYDRELVQTFEMQDEITETLAGTIEPELSRAEQERVRRKPVDNLDAWDLFHRGQWHFWQYTKPAHAEARRLWLQAAQRDPEFAPAFSYLALSYFSSFMNGLDATPDSFRIACEYAEQALAIDDKESMPRFVLGRVYTLSGRISSAVEELNLAVRLNPSFAQAHYGLGAALHTLERWEESVEACATAERLSPRDPMVSAFQSTRALALAMGGQMDDARRVAREATRNPTATYWSHVALASILGNMGLSDEAGAALARLLELRPDFSEALFDRIFRRSKHETWPDGRPHLARAQIFDGLYKAGLPRSVPDGDLP